MQTIPESNVASQRGRPWNKGKFVGHKPPLQPKHVWAIRTRLQLAKKKRDLALFNLAIRQQAAGMRSGELEGGAHRTPRLCN